MSTRKFCSTVSNAFAKANHDLKLHIDNFKEKELDWKKLSLKQQYEGLVASPLRDLNLPAILIIDALDELDERNDLPKLMEALRDTQPSVPLLRTFITARPEGKITQLLRDFAGIRTVNFQDLEGDNEDVEKYIRFKLKNQASDIQDRVIRRAGGHFLWAGMACERLADTLNIEGALNELEGPSDAMDSIYMGSLNRAARGDKLSQGIMILVLRMLLALRTPLSIADLTDISLWSETDVVGQTITRLASLLRFKNRDDPIRLIHTTFREFLTSQNRAGEYFIQPQFGHHALALGCLKVLRNLPDFDIVRNPRG